MFPENEAGAEAVRPAYAGLTEGAPARRLSHGQALLAVADRSVCCRRGVPRSGRRRRLVEQSSARARELEARDKEVSRGGRAS